MFPCIRVSIECNASVCVYNVRVWLTDENIVPIETTSLAIPLALRYMK